MFRRAGNQLTACFASTLDIGRKRRRVEATASSFTPSDWVLATASLVVIVAIWHEYLMMLLRYVWLPTLVDSAVPFGFLVTEGFMVHFLSADHRLWLLGYAVGVTAWGVQVRQVRMFNDENREVRDVMGRKARSLGLLAGGVALSSLLAAALYDVLRLDSVDLVVALLPCAGSACFWRAPFRISD